ncbi:four helix bundle protein [Patescibacteria group bacterium]
MSNEKNQNKNGVKKFDLEERTAKFGEEIIEFVKKIIVNEVTKRIISHLVGAGTGVGANYCEADCAESNKDFIHKMGIANKEIKESKHFIRMMVKACPKFAKEGRVLWKEASELNLIFSTIIHKAKNKDKDKENK